ncbi:GNAT family N-acetyltransferase [Laceyella putida]|uniref:GNAT family N-acetyltransferase n=1 Tax=Laceyella putida TaxID=110101 RepID=A0ABW2RJF0_9BACL
MFSLNGVTLRPFEPEDIEIMYDWHLDYELDIYSSWGKKLSRAQFKKKFEQNILDNSLEGCVVFGIEVSERLVGQISLESINRQNRYATIYINIGERGFRGRGIGRTAIRIMVDYGFKVENLEKIYAEIYGFNSRSQRCFECVGFQREGVCRKHEIHNGERHDIHLFGILKEEFYERYETLFKLPK